MSANGVGELIDELRQARSGTLALMARFSPADLDRVSRIREKTVRDMLRMMIDHYRVHGVQIYNQRIAAGQRANEVNGLIAGAQAAFEAAMADSIGLSDENGNKAPAEGEWSARQILEHLLEFELRYQQEFERLLDERRGER